MSKKIFCIETALDEGREGGWGEGEGRGVGGRGRGGCAYVFYEGLTGFT